MRRERETSVFFCICSPMSWRSAAPPKTLGFRWIAHFPLDPHRNPSNSDAPDSFSAAPAVFAAGIQIHCLRHMQKMTRRAADKKCSADLMAKHNEIKSPTSNAGNARALLCVCIFSWTNKQRKTTLYPISVPKWWLCYNQQAELQKNRRQANTIRVIKRRINLRWKFYLQLEICINIMRTLVSSHCHTQKGSASSWAVRKI